MSYILDSLKKAEQERRQGNVPGLQSDHERPPQRPMRFPLWAGLLAAALVINASLLLWWLRPWQPAAPETAAVRGPAHLSPSVPAQSPAAKRPATAADPGGSGAGPEKPALAAEAPTATLPAPPLPDEAPAAAAIPAPAPAVEARSSPSVPAIAQPVRPTPPAAVAEAPRPVSESTAAAGASGTPGRLPTLAELSPALRGQVPKLDVSLHFYTPQPSARLVRINDRNLREGQPLGGGLVLEEITPAGVILSLQGERFRVED